MIHMSLKGQFVDDFDTGFPIANVFMAIIVITLLTIFLGHITSGFRSGFVNTAPSETMAIAGIDNASASLDDVVKWFGIFLTIFVIAIILKMVVGAF